MPNETNFSTAEEWNCAGKALGEGSERGLSSLNRDAQAFLGLKTQWSKWSKVGGGVLPPFPQPSPPQRLFFF